MFQIALNSQIYVDKSGLIAHLNSILGTEQRYVCVSRPRRFGKSMSANMVAAYYDRGCNSHAQFDDLAIAKDPAYERHLNRYDVIHLNMHDFLSASDSMQDMVAYITEEVGSELSLAFPEARVPSRGGLPALLASVFATSGVPFVFTIDEWDAVFRMHRGDTRAQTLYLDWLRALLKDKPYVALAYMTGILPIKKYGQHSALNMFTEVSMTDATPISEFTGFTEAEVTVLSGRYGADIDELRAWYDGYDVDGIAVYNPRSVVQSLMRGNVGNYWTQTETFEALRSYIEMDMDGLRSRIVRLVAGESIAIDATTFQNDMVTFASADDVLTLLVHLGYLTYDSTARTVSIPNREVSEQYASTLRVSGWKEVAGSLERSDRLLAATLGGDAGEVARLVQQTHREAASVLRYNDENSLACTVSLAYYTARRKYIVHRELPAGKGFADLAFVPRPGIPDGAIVIELKYGSTPEAALGQIEEHEYATGLARDYGRVLMVGIAYDPVTKEHSCAMRAL